MIEPVFEKINFNQTVGTINEYVKVQTKTQLENENIRSVLSVSPFVTILSVDVYDGKVSFAGKLTYYVSYVSESGTLKKIECGSEFAGTIKDARIKETCRVFCHASVEKTEHDISSAFLTLDSNVCVFAEVTACTNLNALSGGSELVVKQKDFECVNTFTAKTGSYPVEQEFELNYVISDVLYHRAEAVITAVQSGVGCIIVDGQVLLSLLLLQNNEKNDIIKENRTIPFRIEVECEEAMPNMQAIARVKEKSFKTDVAVDEDASKSVVSAVVTLDFYGEVSVKTELSVAEDVFSTDSELELLREDCAYLAPCPIESFSGAISGRAGVSELSVGCTVIGVCGEKATAKSEIFDGAVTFTGVMMATVYMRDENGVFTRKVEIPFENRFDLDCEKGVQASVVAKVTNATARIVSLTEIELEAQIFFTLYQAKTCCGGFIKEVKVLGGKEKPTSAISVYIPEEGEQMWSLAKRLNVCPEQMMATNSDLQFPLTGQERIIIFRQK